MKLQPVERLGQELGATAVEYALMVALVAAVLVGVVTFLGVNVIPLYKLTF